MAMWARAVAVAAVIRVILALALHFSGQAVLDRPPPLPIETYVVLTATFGLLGVTLVAANRHDVRATWLGAVFILVSVPLSSPFLRGSAVGDLGWLLFVRPDAFLPAFLWRFVGAFPAPLTGRTRTIAQSIASATAVMGGVIFLINLSFLFWPPLPAAPDWRQTLRPVAGAGSLYYPLVFGLSAAAFVMLFSRARSSVPEDRNRLRLFTGGLVFGLVPIALQGVLEAIPAYNAFTHKPGVEPIVGLTLFTAMAVVPFITAYSVLFDRVVELRIVLRAALQYGLARFTIAGITLVPFAALALIVLRHREEPIVALLSGPRPTALGFTAVMGFAALRLRQPLLTHLDRRFFREQYDARRTLDWLLTNALRVSDTRDFETRIRSAIDRALHADACLYISADGRSALERPGGSPDTISPNSILVTLAAADEAPMDVDPSDDRSPFRRLPAEEQQWLLAARANLLIALRAGDGRPIGLLVLSSKRSGLPYSVEDRRLLSAVGASASLALDNLRLRATPDPAAEAPALECQNCGRLNPPDATSCICGGSLVTASAPYLLRGIFRLDRRLGSGGMGVVYHAHDLSLDRSVAVKTLPRTSPADAARLHREARAMAAVIHPNLAVIHGIESWRGIPFLIEEFLVGGTLADRLSRGPLPLNEALDLCATLAGALEHLHHAGLIHLDLKPSNIGFTQSGVVKLLDFGLARLRRGSAGPADTTKNVLERSAAPTSAERVIAGTLPYMSPEAATGHSPRAGFDLWSLSVVLYESITGRRPFDSSDDLELIASLAAGRFQAPSTLAPACGAEIDQFFSDTFSPISARRPADAAALQAAIMRLRAARR